MSAEEYERLAAIYTPKPARRTCLQCDKKFDSQDPENRICKPCRKALGIPLADAPGPPPGRGRLDGNQL
ncbi:MAG: hypothetical protein WC600_02615 [Desulfobaccales bacterium]